MGLWVRVRSLHRRLKSTMDPTIQKPYSASVLSALGFVGGNVWPTVLFVADQSQCLFLSSSPFACTEQCGADRMRSIAPRPCSLKYIQGAFPSARSHRAPAGSRVQRSRHFSTFTLRAISRSFYPRRLTISPFERRERTYSQDVQHAISAYVKCHDTTLNEQTVMKRAASDGSLNRLYFCISISKALSVYIDTMCTESHHRTVRSAVTPRPRLE
jgi:hypothetical protein